MRETSYLVWLVLMLSTVSAAGQERDFARVNAVVKWVNHYYSMAGAEGCIGFLRLEDREPWVWVVKRDDGTLLIGLRGVEKGLLPLQQQEFWMGVLPRREGGCERMRAILYEKEHGFFFRTLQDLVERGGYEAWLVEFEEEGSGSRLSSESVEGMLALNRERDGVWRLIVAGSDRLHKVLVMEGRRVEEGRRLVLQASIWGGLRRCEAVGGGVIAVGGEGVVCEVSGKLAFWWGDGGELRAPLKSICEPPRWAVERAAPLSERIAGESRSRWYAALAVGSQDEWRAAGFGVDPEVWILRSCLAHGGKRGVARERRVLK